MKKVTFYKRINKLFYLTCFAFGLAGMFSIYSCTERRGNAQPEYGAPAVEEPVDSAANSSDSLP